MCVTPGGARVRGKVGGWAGVVRQGTMRLARWWWWCTREDLPVLHYARCTPSHPHPAPPSPLLPHPGTHWHAAPPRPAHTRRLGAGPGRGGAGQRWVALVKVCACAGVSCRCGVAWRGAAPPLTWFPCGRRDLAAASCRGTMLPQYTHSKKHLKAPLASPRPAPSRSGLAGRGVCQHNGVCSQRVSAAGVATHTSVSNCAGQSADVGRIPRSALPRPALPRPARASRGGRWGGDLGAAGPEGKACVTGGWGVGGGTSTT